MDFAPARQIDGNGAQPSRVVRKIAPHQPGAQRWGRIYGEQLVCVRYRDSSATAERLVTVELVVDRRPAPTRGDDPVAVRIERSETGLRQSAKAVGAQFDWGRRLWLMPRRTARELGLSDRIVNDPSNAVATRRKE